MSCPSLCGRFSLELVRSWVFDHLLCSDPFLTSTNPADWGCLPITGLCQSRTSLGSCTGSTLSDQNFTAAVKHGRRQIATLLSLSPFIGAVPSKTVFVLFLDSGDVNINEVGMRLLLF